MFNWIRELLEIKYEFRERRIKLLEDSKVCQSCNILKVALERANFEKDRLMEKLLEKNVEPVR